MTNSNDKFKFVKIDEFASEHISAPHYSYWKSVFKHFFKSKLAIAMLIMAAIIFAVAMIQPLFSHYNPMASPDISNFAIRFNQPSLANWFGTDHWGNSLFDAVWAGARTSITIALLATTINMVLGISVGAIWGYNKALDKYLLEIYNVVANVPFLLVAIMLMYVLGPGFWQLIFVLCMTEWLSIAFFIRTQVMIIRDREYNLVSKTLGTSSGRMIFRNILPFLTSVIVTLLSREIPSIISTEAFLSYLGVGLPPQITSLGKLISIYITYYGTYPYLFWIPVIVLASISVSFYIVGQTFADASDPKTHR
ncbi:MAG: oligopeptide ABC transporter permease OppC [Erysipelotrichaceae bacterium]